MQATLATRRSFEPSALGYQCFAHAVASVVGGVVAISALGSMVLALHASSLPELLLSNALAAIAGIAASFVWTSAFTFRSAVLIEGPSFRRVAAVAALGLGAHEAAFGAGMALASAAENLAFRIIVASAFAGIAYFLVTLPALHLWGYRVMLPPPPRQVLAGDEGWQASIPRDVELISIAAGERQFAGVWRLRGWLLIYVSTLTLMLAFGWYTTVVLGMANGDGTARVVQAFQVLFSRHPHLAALGFVWPPIPAFTDIPLVALLRPMGLAAYAGSVMGALYGAGAVVMLASVLRALGANRLVTAILTLIFATNQAFYQSVAAGLSEPVLGFFLLASLRAFLAWWQNPQPSYLMYAGLACAGATMCRYEAASWTAGMAVAVMITIYEGIPGLRFLRTPGAGSALEARTRMTSAAWAFLAPTVFVLAVWMILNQQMVGNPIYFLVGQGSTRMSPDTAKLAGERLADITPQGGLVLHAYHSMRGTIALLIDRVSFFSMLLALVTAMTVPLAVWRRDYRTLGLVAIAWSIPAFTLLTGYMGSLPPYARYWYWLLPMGMVLAAYGMSYVRAWGLRVVLWLVILPMAVVPNVRMFEQVYAAASALQLGPHDRAVETIASTPDLGTAQARRAAAAEWRAVAAAANEIPPDKTVILDVAGTSGPVLLYVQHIERFITSTDMDFNDRVLPSLWNSADYLLVPQPDWDISIRSLVLADYPGVWEGQYSWAKPVREVPGPHTWHVLQLSPGLQGATPLTSVPTRPR